MASFSPARLLSSTGRTIAELGLPRDATLVTVLRDRELIQPRPDTRLAADDELVLVVKASAETEVRRVLTA